MVKCCQTGSGLTWTMADQEDTSTHKPNSAFRFARKQRQEHKNNPSLGIIDGPAVSDHRAHRIFLYRPVAERVCTMDASCQFVRFRGLTDESLRLNSKLTFVPGFFPGYSVRRSKSFYPFESPRRDKGVHEQEMAFFFARILSLTLHDLFSVLCCSRGH